MLYKRLLQHRSVWMGIAIIWIVWYHSGIDFGLSILRHIQEIGYGGVDIFFFASGIGCYFSLSSDDDVGRFMKRRLTRLMPTYLIFIVVWLAYTAVIGSFHYQMAIGNIFAIQSFTGLGRGFNWYITTLLLFYILAPYFKKLIDKSSPVGKLLFLLFLIAFSIPFWGTAEYIVCVSRLPIFYFGMLSSSFCKSERKILPLHIIAACISFLIGTLALGFFTVYYPKYLWDYGLYWYPFILMTAPLCMAISGIAIFLERFKITKPIVSFLALCGKYSFEIYLVHVLFFAITRYLIKKQLVSGSGNLIWSITILSTVVGCVILRQLTNLIMRIACKKGSKTHANKSAE